MNLIEFRKLKNLTQKEVSQLSEISESYYSMIESGERRPSVEVAKRIGNVLGIDWTVFFNNPVILADSCERQTK